MKRIFKRGDIKEHLFTVKQEDFATFNGEVLHRVCSTYKLGQEMEWSSRLFMLDVIEEDEEGVGTMLHIDHLSPAFEGETVRLMAIFESFEKGHMICQIEAEVAGRLVAKGRTGQKLLKKNRLKELMTN